MKRVYWRPRAVSRTALVLIGIVSLVGLLLVEFWKVNADRPYADEKLAASKLADRAMRYVKGMRQQIGPPIDISTDPTESGIVGLPMSSVTSVSGVLSAKRTSINPNFSAVIVDMLKRAGVDRGDTVAVGVSGSFPALNICTFAACETLEVKYVSIASASASQWGANVPDLLWIDMERVLAEEGIFTNRSVAASMGGEEDRGLGLSDEGLAAVRAGIERNGLDFLDPPTFEDNVAKRMDIYRQGAQGQPIKCYINIGGGAVSVGRSRGKHMLKPGLNQRPTLRLGEIDGVMQEYLTQGVPVIHLVQVVDLAERYGLPIEPLSFPEVGEANVFKGIDYNKFLVAAVLAIILGCLYGFIRSDIGFRLLSGPKSKVKDARPEPMV